MKPKQWQTNPPPSKDSGSLCGRSTLLLGPVQELIFANRLGLGPPLQISVGRKQSVLVTYPSAIIFIPIDFLLVFFGHQLVALGIIESSPQGHLFSFRRTQRKVLTASLSLSSCVAFISSPSLSVPLFSTQNTSHHKAIQSGGIFAKKQHQTEHTVNTEYLDIVFKNLRLKWQKFCKETE